MENSWKAPTAVLGIVTIVISAVTFWYQHKNDQRKNDIVEETRRQKQIDIDDDKKQIETNSSFIPVLKNEIDDLEAGIKKLKGYSTRYSDDDSLILKFQNDISRKQDSISKLEEANDKLRNNITELTKSL